MKRKNKRSISIAAIALTLIYCCNIGYQQVKHVTTAPVNEHKRKEDEEIRI